MTTLMSIQSSIVANEMTISQLAQVLSDNELDNMLEVLDIFVNIVELNNCTDKRPLSENIQLFNKLT